MRLAPSQPVQPIERAAAGVSDGDDQAFFVAEGDDDHVRESLEQLTTDVMGAGIGFQSGHPVRAKLHRRQGELEFGEEFVAEAGAALVVPGRRVAGLFESFGKQVDIHSEVCPERLSARVCRS